MCVPRTCGFLFGWFASSAWGGLHPPLRVVCIFRLCGLHLPRKTFPWCSSHYKSSAREPTRGTLSPAVALGPDCWTHNTQLTGQLTRWRCIVGFSGTDTGEEGGAQGRGHRTHELISHPAPGAVARASAGVLWTRSLAGARPQTRRQSLEPHPRSAPALRRDPARC